MMIDRKFESIVRQKLLQTPAVVLLGPRQVGKTTLALEAARTWPQASVYLDLERPADRLKLDDADGFLRMQGDKLVILDEIHRLPGLFEVLRGIIDDKRLADLNVYPAFGMSDFKAVPPAWRSRIPEYVKDYVSLNQFM